MVFDINRPANLDNLSRLTSVKRDFPAKSTLEISAPRCALMCYPSSNITYCIACLLCIGVILLNKFNSIQFSWQVCPEQPSLRRGTARGNNSLTKIRANDEIMYHACKLCEQITSNWLLTTYL